MSSWVWLNEDYCPADQARVSVFDRGFLFADGVYEVTAVVNGELLDFHAHMQRLQRSCRALELAFPWAVETLQHIHETLVARNQLQEGSVYLQITRGNPGKRDFHYPDVSVPPTLVVFTQSHNILQDARVERGLSVVTCPDIRWQRCDIKTVSLLAASMAKMAAQAQGADDAVFVTDGLITEASSANCFMVTPGGKLVTRALSQAILPGITRAAILEICQQHHLEIETRAFSPQEACGAREVFITSATTFVMPVTRLDGNLIGDGRPGPVAISLRNAYLSHFGAGLQRDANTFE
ncbi:D-amino-acid transaminase [Mangrovibacter phragmitis]|uniref:D-amino-acid transaminase n=1 Tax=Mangrovibacter phragmitis TaxID=1691903 RepID=UPI003516527B